MLELDFGVSPWWSTRVDLVALAAADYTSIEALAFTQNERFVATVSVRSIRRRLCEVGPELEGAYLRQRGMALVPGALPQPADFMTIIGGMAIELQAWPGGERAFAQDASEAWLRATFGADLSVDRVASFQGSARALDLHDILSKRSRFVALVSAGDILERVVDRYELGSSVAASLVRDLLRP